MSMVTIKGKLSILNRIAFLWFAITGSMKMHADTYEVEVTDEEGDVIYTQKVSK